MKYLWFLALIFAGCDCDHKIIDKVGSCDTRGNCGVTYTDGTTGFQPNFPTPGKEAAECF